jgi:hypothetical protein
LPYENEYYKRFSFILLIKGKNNLPI